MSCADFNSAITTCDPIIPMIPDMVLPLVLAGLIYYWVRRRNRSHAIVKRGSQVAFRVGEIDCHAADEIGTLGPCCY